MNFNSFLYRTNVKQHSPALLAIAAGIGTIATAYLASKASFKAAKVLEEYDENEGVSDNRKERVKDVIKVTWKLYIPTAVSAGVTIGCIVGSNRVGARKLLASQAALSVSQQLYSEYREKVIEELGARKDQAIHDMVVEDRIKANPPPSAEMLVIGDRDVLCCELFTGRYFSCDMETLKKSQNELNQKLFSQDYATMNDFYYMIGLKPTTTSGNIGWKVGKLMELQFSSTIADDGRPVLTFEYNYTTQL